MILSRVVGIWPIEHSCFVKKSPKTPPGELELSRQRMAEYMGREPAGGPRGGPEDQFRPLLERKLQDAEFRARFETADQAWDIALQLTALRQARGLTQKQVAELLGTKQQAIARLEDPAYTGHSLSMVQKYVLALGANLDVTIIPAETTSEYAAQRSPKPLLAAR